MNAFVIFHTLLVSAIGLGYFNPSFKRKSRGEKKEYVDIYIWDF